MQLSDELLKEIAEENGVGIEEVTDKMIDAYLNDDYEDGIILEEEERVIDEDDDLYAFYDDILSQVE